MFAIIITFLKSHWQTSFIASALLAVVATIAVQHLEVLHYRNALAACRAEGSALEASNQRLVSAVESQNDSVMQLQKQGIKRSAAAIKVLKLAQTRAATLSRRVSRLADATPLTDDCRELRRLIDGYTTEVK